MFNRAFVRFIPGIALLFFISSASYGQTDHDFRETLRGYLHRIDERQNDYRSVLSIDDSLSYFLVKTLPNIPRTLYSSFDSISWRLYITTAPDTNVRIWCWNDGSKDRLDIGGNIVEFRTSSGIKTGMRPRSTFDPFGRCDSILIAHCFDQAGKPFVYYIAVFSYSAESGFRKRDIQLYRIENGIFQRQANFFTNFPGRQNPHDSLAINLYYRIPQTAQAKKLESITLCKSKREVVEDDNVLLVPFINKDHEIDSTSQEYEEQGGMFFIGGERYYPKPGESLNDLNRMLGSADRKINLFVDSSREHTRHYDDSLWQVSAWLTDFLKATLPRIPRSMEADIDSSWDYVSFENGGVQKYRFIWLASSPDHKMRIWTWDTWTGGSMPSFKNLAEYQTSTGIKVTDFESAEVFDTIYSIAQPNGKTLYLPSGTWRGDGRNSGSGLYAFEINGENLNTDVRVFPPVDTFNREYTSDFSASCEDCTIPQMKVEGKKLSIQHIDGSGDKDVLTSKFDEYEFDGEHFVYRGISK